MKNPRKELSQQIQRIPMDPVLRDEVLSGVESLGDSEAENKAVELKTALDSLPGLAQRMRSARERRVPKPKESLPDDVQVEDSPSPREREIAQMVAKGLDRGKLR